MSWAWWDWPLTWLTNHHPSVLWHCWLGHVTCKIVSEMTYNVSRGMLKPTIPYRITGCGSACSTVLTATIAKSMGNGGFCPLQNRNPWADGNNIRHNWLRSWEDPLNQIWYKSIHWGLLGKCFVLYLFISTFVSQTRVQVRPVDAFLRAICVGDPA